jgi:hypothetical protein
VEKTLEFTIKEALESGRQSAMPQFLEMELREKIAQEIESRIINVDSNDIVKLVAEKAADIARGN